VHLATPQLSLKPRTVRLTAGLALLALLAGFAALFSSGAGRANALVVWCAGDPAIIVNGNPVDVTVSVPLSELSSISDVTVTYHVAKNANVLLGINTGILFHEKIVIVKDQPAQYGLLSVSKIPVDVTVHYTGAAFPIGVTQIALGGTHLWINGMSNQVTHATAYSLLNLGLL